MEPSQTPMSDGLDAAVNLEDVPYEAPKLPKQNYVWEVLSDPHPEFKAPEGNRQTPLVELYAAPIQTVDGQTTVRDMATGQEIKLGPQHKTKAAFWLDPASLSKYRAFERSSGGDPNFKGRLSDVRDRLLASTGRKFTAALDYRKGKDGKGEFREIGKFL